MIVAIAATSTMSIAGLAMSDRWRQSSDGVDLDQPFWHPLGIIGPPLNAAIPPPEV